ncbi:hypothetical protein BV25DRAFT_1825044 [Artomyces pyxidatus]|uniref:Uncharacterized protein n=1 Tax=Artomyces pyxidatus TaxID=48021 RepID=A0ACB8T4D6_9AGAM|nr:hypothetical protein BV25DRAFT_1825044 [Artomyces pyxidatus]
MSHPLPHEHHYIRFSLAPPCADALAIRHAVHDALAIRHAVHDALAQSFGLASSGTYVDVLWVAEDGGECTVRTRPGEAARVMAAVAVSAGRLRLSVQKESPFLPSVSADTLVI